MPPSQVQPIPSGTGAGVAAGLGHRPPPASTVGWHAGSVEACQVQWVPYVLRRGSGACPQLLGAAPCMATTRADTSLNTQLASVALTLPADTGSAASRPSF